LKKTLLALRIGKLKLTKFRIFICICLVYIVVLTITLTSFGLFESSDLDDLSDQGDENDQTDQSDENDLNDQTDSRNEANSYTDVSLTNRAREIELEGEIREILAGRLVNYTVYIKVLGEDFEIGISEDELFYPASIYKVPIAILVLKDIEDGRYTLQKQLAIKEENKFYASDNLYYKENGTLLTVEELLWYMIHYSDNTAWDMLMDNLLGSTKEIDVRIEEELGLENTQKAPEFQTTAKEVGEAFEGIYNGEYLNKENSEYLLELLSDITPPQNDKIPAGVPEGTRVAHKIGWWTGNYQDAGIVFGEECDYIIVILNRNTTVDQGRSDIVAISRATWEVLQGEE
jgi:beta-lactamase class A